MKLSLKTGYSIVEFIVEDGNSVVTTDVASNGKITDDIITNVEDVYFEMQHYNRNDALESVKLIIEGRLDQKEIDQLIQHLSPEPEEETEDDTF